MKIGDELLCKCKFSYKITSAGIFIKNKKYRITNISTVSTINLYVIDNKHYTEEFVNRIFYSNQEIRKLKLEKLKK